MTTSLLEQFLVSELFAFLLIFSRVGAGIMLLPGIGEAYVSPRLRLVFALMMSLVMLPVFGADMPPMPGSPLALFVLLTAEILVGLFLGFLSRMLVSTLHIAGNIIANQSSLALASILDISQSGQSTIIGNYLTMTAMVLFFALDLHHVMLMGLADSYSMFPPGGFPIVGDMSQHLMQTFSQVFMVALQLSAPHIVFALIFYLSSGVLSRLMPTMQVFFILMPAQIMIAFFLLMALLTSIMLNYTNFVEESLRAFLEH
jgi:flagellar biosynthetic protein FliR